METIKRLHYCVRLAMCSNAKGLGATMTDSRKREQDPHTLQTGHLDVGNGHRIFWEEWGNRDAAAIFHLHGGPGAGYKPRHKLLYDPLRHRVIFHHQRGCGKSEPYGETSSNATGDLISDIDALRILFGLDRIYVAGGSWGSTLALVYAIAHPDRVKRLVLWGIYLARQCEDDFVNAGGAKYIYPEAWDRFIRKVPAEHQGDGPSIMTHYATMIRSADPNVAREYSDEWVLWESTLACSSHDQRVLEQEILATTEREDKLSENFVEAKIQTHYFPNGCFIRHTPILENLYVIKHIPCLVVQGRFDLCTPAISAYQLSREYGDNLHLQWVNSGHSASPEMHAALRATIAADFTG